MSKAIISESLLTGIGDAIRAKNGSSVTYTPAEMATAIGQISGGGTEEPDVYFIDYDGTILHTYTKAEFLELTQMPANPDHTDMGLTSQGWNWTLANVKTELSTYDNIVVIGQMYVTTSGNTEIDIEPTEDTLDVRFNLAVNGTVNINWGDGNSENVTGTNINSNKTIDHNYNVSGNYTITISSINSGIFNFNKRMIENSHTNSTAGHGSYTQMVKKIRIGKNIEKLNGCCQDFYNLSYITLPSNITALQNQAFYNCYNLSSITIPSQVSDLSYGSDMFSRCQNLKTASLPLGSTKLSAFFSYCYKLNIVNIPSSVTEITSNNIFSYCCSLTRIKAPSVQKGLNGAFQYCHNLSSVSLPSYQASTIQSSMFAYCDSLKTITFPSSTAIINFQNSVFLDCHSLSSIALPPSATCFGNQTFSGCRSLSSVTLPSSVTTLGNQTFYNCFNLSTITLPNSLTTAGNQTFYYCYNLPSIILPDSLTSLGHSAFYYCYNLQSANLPIALSSAGSNLFYNCYNLTDVTIASTALTSIPSQAFYCCYSLTNLTIPKNVTSIATSAFYSCLGMKEYHFASTIVPTLSSTNAFQNIPANCKIYVPSSQLNDYKTADNWLTFASYMAGE